MSNKMSIYKKCIVRVYTMNIILINLQIFILNASTFTIFTCKVNEKSPKNTFVCDIGANLTKSLNITINQITYQLRYDANTPEYFNIDSNSGILTTTTSIDRDSLCPYMVNCSIRLDVQITSPNYFSLLPIEVDIIGLNDNAPVFNPNSTTWYLTSNSPTGSVFDLPPADDKDGGINGIQKYITIPSLYSNFFTLIVSQLGDGSTSLSLKLVSTLTNINSHLIQLTIQAIDGGNPSLNGNLTVSINISFSSTVISPTDILYFINSSYFATIKGNISPVTNIVQVKAVYKNDVLPILNIVYSFDPLISQPCLKNFGMNSITGQIYTITSFDYKTFPSCFFYVDATDKSFPNRAQVVKTKIIVQVLNIEGNPPLISLISSDVTTKVKTGTVSGVFIAYLSISNPNDKLFSNTLNASCILTNYKNLFELQSVSTDFKMITSLTFGNISFVPNSILNVSVICFFNNYPNYYSLIVINVTILASGPSFNMNKISVIFLENNPIGSFVTNVTVIDKDLGAVLIFKIIPMNNSPNYLIIDSETGFIHTNNTFNYVRIDGLPQEYLYSVLVEDNFNSPILYASTILSLQVMKDNTFVSTTGFTSLGTSIGQPIVPNSNIIITAVICSTIITIVTIIAITFIAVCCKKIQNKANLVRQTSSALPLGSGSYLAGSSPDFNLNLERSVSLSCSDKSVNDINNKNSFNNTNLKTVQEEPMKIQENKRSSVSSSASVQNTTFFKRKVLKSKRKSNQDSICKTATNNINDPESDSGTSGSYNDSGCGPSEQEPDKKNKEFVYDSKDLKPTNDRSVNYGSNVQHSSACNDETDKTNFFQAFRRNNDQKLYMNNFTGVRTTAMDTINKNFIKKQYSAPISPIRIVDSVFQKRLSFINEEGQHYFKNNNKTSENKIIDNEKKFIINNYSNKNSSTFENRCAILEENQVINNISNHEYLTKYPSRYNLYNESNKINSNNETHLENLHINNCKINISEKIKTDNYCIPISIKNKQRNPSFASYNDERITNGVTKLTEPNLHHILIKNSNNIKVIKVLKNQIFNKIPSNQVNNNEFKLQEKSNEVFNKISSKKLLTTKSNSSNLDYIYQNNAQNSSLREQIPSDNNKKRILTRESYSENVIVHPQMGKTHIPSDNDLNDEDILFPKDITNIAKTSSNKLDNFKNYLEAIKNESIRLKTNEIKRLPCDTFV